MNRLVLLGGGHAHLRVLAELARRPLRGWEVLLLTPDARQVYSGMLPGWIAGHYTLAQCAIDLQSLARAAGAGLVLDAATGLDLPNRVVHTRARENIAYDVLSIDVGSAPPAGEVAGTASHAVAVRPLPRFVAAWDSLVERVHGSCRPFSVAVLGAGAGGVELALALRHRSLREGWSHLAVHLVGADAAPLSVAPERARLEVMRLLRRRCIHWHGPSRAIAVHADHLELAGGNTVPADACWIVTGASAPRWLADSELATVGDGFVRVHPTLQSVSHAQVFAAGDAASHPDSLPKSGVYAVQAGAVLARNLYAYCAGEPLRAWRPPARALYLLSTGDRRALAIWGDAVGQGAWAWYWKDWIDRKFIRRYNRYSTQQAGITPSSR